MHLSRVVRLAIILFFAKLAIISSATSIFFGGKLSRMAAKRGGLPRLVVKAHHYRYVTCHNTATYSICVIHQTARFRVRFGAERSDWVDKLQNVTKQFTEIHTLLPALGSSVVYAIRCLYFIRGAWSFRKNHSMPPIGRGSEGCKS